MSLFNSASEANVTLELIGACLLIVALLLITVAVLLVDAKRPESSRDIFALRISRLASVLFLLMIACEYARIYLDANFDSVDNPLSADFVTCLVFAIPATVFLVHIILSTRHIRNTRKSSAALECTNSEN